MPQHETLLPFALISRRPVAAHYSSAVTWEAVPFLLVLVAIRWMTSLRGHTAHAMTKALVVP